MRIKTKLLLGIISVFLPLAIAAAQEVKESPKVVDQKVAAAAVQDVKAVGEVVESVERIVKGAAFSAEAVTESIQMLADGNRITRRTTTKMYRDSQGRFRREELVQLGGNVGSMVEVPPTVLIIDPTINSKYFLYPGSKTIHQVDWKIVSETDFKIKGDVNEVLKLDGAEKVIIGKNGFELKKGEKDKNKHSQSQSQNGQSNSNSNGQSNSNNNTESKEQIAERKAEIRNQIAETKAELQAEKRRIAKIAAEFNSVKHKISAKEAQSTIKGVEGFKKEIEKAKKEIEKIKEAALKGEISAGELESVKKEVEDFKKEIEKIRQEIQETIEKMKEAIRKNESRTSYFSKVNVITESLGVQIIEKIEAEGTRFTHTIGAGEIGNELPIKIVYEKWYSKDLQTIVMSKHFDPRFGENNYRLTNIKRTEPDISLFTLPADYRIINPKKPRIANPKSPKFDVNSPRISKPRTDSVKPNPPKLPAVEKKTSP